LIDQILKETKNLDKQAEAYFFKGKCLQNLNNIPDAITSYTSSVSLNLHHYGASIHLATLLLQTGHFSPSIPYYLNALHLNPSSPSPYLGLTLALKLLSPNEDSLLHHFK